MALQESLRISNLVKLENQQAKMPTNLVLVKAVRQFLGERLRESTANNMQSGMQVHPCEGMC